MPILQRDNIKVISDFPDATPDWLARQVEIEEARLMLLGAAPELIADEFSGSVYVSGAFLAIQSRNGLMSPSRPALIADLGKDAITYAVTIGDEQREFDFVFSSQLREARLSRPPEDSVCFVQIQREAKPDSRGFMAATGFLPVGESVVPRHGNEELLQTVARSL